LVIVVPKVVVKFEVSGFVVGVSLSFDSEVAFVAVSKFADSKKDVSENVVDFINEVDNATVC